MPLNYDQSKVYKIWSPQGDKIYIGSTTKQYLSQRMTLHRGSYNYWKSGKGGLITSFLLFDEYGLDNCFIELLEAKPCASRDEMKQLEGGYIRNLACVNKCIAGRTMKEYHEDNKTRINKTQKEYQEINKEKVKQYYEKNKERISEKAKEYRENNKERQSLLNKQICA